MNSTSFNQLPAVLQAKILAYCPDSSKLAAGITCKNLYNLVHGSLVGRHETQMLWSKKLKTLKERVHWGLKSDPQDTQELFTILNAPLTLLDSHRDHNNRKYNNFRGLNSQYYYMAKEQVLKGIFTAPISDALQKYSLLERATFEMLLPKILDSSKSLEDIRAIARKVFSPSRNEAGKGLLSVAAGSNDIRAMQVLIEEAGVPVNQTSADGSLPLNQLILHKDSSFEAIKMFVEEYGAKGTSPLQNLLDGAQRGDLKIFTYFYDKGSLVPKQDCQFSRDELVEVLDMAVKYKHKELQEYLLIEILKHFPGSNLSILMSAILKNQPTVLDLVLKMSNSNLVNEVNEEGATPLMIAAFNSDVNLINSLLNNGATKTINAVDNKGLSALLYALRVNKVNVAELLLDKGASAAI